MKKLIIAIILLMASVAFAADQTVTFEWDANSETDLAGYTLYEGDSAGGPWVKINETYITETTYAITYSDPLEIDKWWTLTASDTRGNESDKCAAVTTSIDTISPAVPGSLHIIIGGSVQLTVNGPVTVVSQ